MGAHPFSLCASNQSGTCGVGLEASPIKPITHQPNLDYWGFSLVLLKPQQAIQEQIYGDSSRAPEPPQQQHGIAHDATHLLPQGQQQQQQREDRRAPDVVDRIDWHSVRKMALGFAAVPWQHMQHAQLTAFLQARLCMSCNCYFDCLLDAKPARAFRPC